MELHPLDWVAVGTFFVALLINFGIYDYLVRTEYHRHREQWVREGKPLGMFWFPWGQNPFTASWTRGIVMFRWLFKTPGWAFKEKKATKLFVLYRCFFVLATIAWLVLLNRMLHEG
jgi:hypothetical protein